MTFDELMSLPAEPFVQAAYQAILGRDADPAGLRHYLRRLQKGSGRAAVLADLAGSREQTELGRHRDLAGLEDDTFIEALYLRLLGRSADSAGKRYYLARLAKKGGRQRTIQDMELSGEAAARHPQEASFRRDLHELLRDEQQARGWRAWLLRGRNRNRDRELHRLHERLNAVGGQLTALQEQLRRQGWSSGAAGPDAASAQAAADVVPDMTPQEPSFFSLMKDVKASDPSSFLAEFTRVVAASREACGLVRTTSKAASA
jgi:hypothetical protein